MRSVLRRNCDRLSQTFNGDSVFCRRTTTGAGWILLAYRRRGETEDDCRGVDFASFQLVIEDGWPMDLDLRSGRSSRRVVFRYKLRGLV